MLRSCWGRGLARMIASSQCLMYSDNRHGFCHFHLNCNSHWWWLLFHFQSLHACPANVSFLAADNCLTGTICSQTNVELLYFIPNYIDIYKIKIQELNLFRFGGDCFCPSVSSVISNSGRVFQLLLCWYWNRGQWSAGFIGTVLQWTIWFSLQNYHQLGLRSHNAIVGIHMR